jgi:PAS domain S-box-containing protein
MMRGELRMGRGTADVKATCKRVEGLADLLELSYEPMFAWALDGSIEAWGTGAERLYGFAAGEAIGRTSHAMLQTRFPIPFEDLQSRLRAEGHWSGELRHVCKDGREVVVDSRMQLLRGELVLEANRDITQVQTLVARQAALLRAESASAAKFEALFSQSGLFAGIMDLDGTLREANDLSLESCGYTRDQVLGRPFWETPWWRGSEEVKARIRLASEQAAAGSVFREALPYWVADGSERAVDFSMHPIRDRSGAVMFLHPSGTDITERKRIEAVLRDSEQRLGWLAAIVESSDDAIVSKTLDGIISSWNAGAERIFGYSAAEAVGQPITIVIPHDRLDEERTILTRIRRGERIDHFDTVRQRKNGGLINVSLTVSPIKNAAGVIVGASKIARDVSEQKLAQERIATLAREAEHRAKNLLANVQATVKLSRAETPEALKEAIEGRIQALANVHSLFVETRWIGAELTSIATQELAPYAAKDERRIRIDGPQVLLEPSVAQSIAVALHELATNAAKYGALSADTGRVHLAWTHAADGQLDLRWTETGGPAVQPPTRQGFGTRIVKQMSGQLRGDARFDWRREGLCCEMTLKT